jgi:hypothetical protein
LKNFSQPFSFYFISLNAETPLSWKVKLIISQEFPFDLVNSSQMVCHQPNDFGWFYFKIQVLAVR